jgi:putative FmdB family regulatory protein
MPTYEYECSTCGARFQEFQTMSDAPLTRCRRCGAGVERIVSGGAGFIIKGAKHGGSQRDRCSLETSGTTCCGRDERCGRPACGNEEG